MFFKILLSDKLHFLEFQNPFLSLTDVIQMVVVRTTDILIL